MNRDVTDQPVTDRHADLRRVARPIALADVRIGWERAAREWRSLELLDSR